MAAEERTWECVRDEVLEAARGRELIPFLGSAVSHFRPTSLPMGDGLIRAVLKGVLDERFEPEQAVETPEQREQRREEESRILDHSPEVILQALAEGLESRESVGGFYNQMAGLPANRFHYILARALVADKVPAIFTTNQDDCLERAAEDRLSSPIQYSGDSGSTIQPTIYQFHGTTGGATAEEQSSRLGSLTFSLHSMGPQLPESKEKVFLRALADNVLLVLGHSASDPDIWYSLERFLRCSTGKVIYWCYYGSPSRHLTRLAERFPGSIKAFEGDICQILPELGGVWEVDVDDTPEPTEPPKEEVEARWQNIRKYPLKLSTEQRDLAYGWLLLGTGCNKHAADVLDGLSCRSRKNSGQDSQRMLMMSLLFAGYAHRELSEHDKAQVRLAEAMRLSAPDQLNDPYRHAQAVHKMGESEGTVERVLPWYFWPQYPRLNRGARWLLQAIREYRRVGQDEFVERALSRAGLGAAIMNLGQLYRRAALYPIIPQVFRMRGKLNRMAESTLADAVLQLRKEGDMRQLAMDLAALKGVREHLSKNEWTSSVDTTVNEAVDVDRAIEMEMAEEWTKDDIQVGAAYYQRALSREAEPQQQVASAEDYARALQHFRLAGMQAEIARSDLDLARVLARDYARTVKQTEGNWSWKLIMSLMWSARVIIALLRNPWFALPVLCIVGLIASLIVGLAVILTLLAVNAL